MELPGRYYGALKESVHIAGYSFERACSHLEWLLEGERWQQTGEQFENVNRFMDSIRLDGLRGTVEQRKRIANRIKQLQPEVTIPDCQNPRAG